MIKSERWFTFEDLLKIFEFESFREDEFELIHTLKNLIDDIII